MRAWQLALLSLVTLGCDEMRLRDRRRPAQRALGPSLFDERAAGRRSRAADAPDASPRVAARVHAKARFVWIRKRPESDADWLGYLTLGQSIAVRDDPRGVVSQGGEVCESWVPVEPKGWVCVGRDATLAEDDPMVQILEQSSANLGSAWPFDYARSLETPRYRRLPSERDERAKEGDVERLKARIEKASKAKDAAAIKAIDPRLVGAELGPGGGPVPALFDPPYTVLESDDDLKLGSTIAYVSTFDHHGRGWLLSWDRAIIPLVRVKKYERSPFHGVELDEQVELPLAFSKKLRPRKWRRAAHGAFEPSDASFEPQSLVELGAGRAEAGGRTLLETEESGVWVDAAEVVVIAPEGKPPARLPETGRRTWVEVSTVGGWIVAFEGERPVWASLISAGRAETLPNGKMRPASSTPTGTFTVLSKLRTTTMRSELRPDNVHAEVMYTQVFFENFALHGAYWHDEWGDRKSAGCVNLSPIDSKWLFDWSEPTLPPDWHAKRVESGEPVTWVVVHT